jgi:hypothetical protein
VIPAFGNNDHMIYRTTINRIAKFLLAVNGLLMVIQTLHQYFSLIKHHRELAYSSRILISTRGLNIFEIHNLTLSGLILLVYLIIIWRTVNAKAEFRILSILLPISSINLIVIYCISEIDREISRSVASTQMALNFYSQPNLSSLICLIFGIVGLIFSAIYWSKLYFNRSSCVMIDK